MILTFFFTLSIYFIDYKIEGRIYKILLRKKREEINLTFKLIDLDEDLNKFFGDFKEIT